jgi:hypothetical protein
MNKGLMVLLWAMLIAHPVSAEELGPADAAIALQAQRFNAAYDSYRAACLDLDEDGQRRQKLRMRESAECLSAKRHYLLQAEVLSVLINGPVKDVSSGN